MFFPQPNTKLFVAKTKLCAAKWKNKNRFFFLSWTYWTTLDLSFTVTYKHCVPQHGCSSLGWVWVRPQRQIIFFGCKLEIREYFITFCIRLYRPVWSLSRDAHLLSTATLGRRATSEQLVSDVLKATSLAELALKIYGLILAFSHGNEEFVLWLTLVEKWQTCSCETFPERFIIICASLQLYTAV